MSGSPPPARGALSASSKQKPEVGITPACAGSIAVSGLISVALRDHPRLRGEHIRASCRLIWITGSPPPARGALLTGTPLSQGVGITPACAGSIWPPLEYLIRLQDHPRLRGEHNDVLRQGHKMLGSPPPARGA